MKAAVDVDYRDTHAVAACVLFHEWTDEHPADERVARIASVAPYEPGAFYKRELPCILAVLEPVLAQLDTIVVDGHAWLAHDKPGLGVHVAQATKIAVVGVAKTRFHEGVALPVLRGKSAVPLWVSAEGMPAEAAAKAVASLHGPHRLPTLLRRVDRLARDS